MIRKPAVGGYFYPGREKELREMVKRMVISGGKKEKALAIVSPHAGFEYSGSVAGAVFSSAKLPERFVILGPSHRPIRSLFAIMAEGDWETPLGRIKVDSPLAEQVMRHCAQVEVDEVAHLQEHSLEVQLPFIQFFKKDFSIVPICVSITASFEDLQELGKSISRGIQEISQEVMVVASTDMSHYVSQEVAEKKDFLAIEKVLKLDAEGLYDVVTREDISMCGYQPTVTAIVAAKDLGAKKATLIKYQTSGDRTGNYHEVVGYAGIRIS